MWSLRSVFKAFSSTQRMVFFDLNTALVAFPLKITSDCHIIILITQCAYASSVLRKYLLYWAFLPRLYHIYSWFHFKTCFAPSYVVSTFNIAKICMRTASLWIYYFLFVHGDGPVFSSFLKRLNITVQSP